MQALKTNGQMYDSVDLGKVVRSGFDMSFFNKGTGRIGAIIPTRCLEVLPGDKLQGQSSAAIQFDPLAVPILSNMQVRQETFYAPFNTVFDKFDDFIRGGEDGKQKIPLPSRTFGELITVIFRDIFYDSIATDAHSVMISPSADSTVLSGTYFADFSTWIHDYNHVIDSVREYGVAHKVSDIMEHVVIPNIQTLIKYVVNITSTPSGGAWSKEEDRLYLFLKEPVSKYDELSSVFDSIAVKINEHAKSLLQGSNLNAQYHGQYIQRAKDMMQLCPTEEFYAILRMQYEIMRPFIGTSSLLDYMNITRFTFRDYVYNALVDIYCAQVETAITYLLNSDNDIYSDIDTVGLVGLNLDLLSPNPINMLPLRALYSIWYNYYRDQLLETDILEPQKTSSISDLEVCMLLIPRQRCWAKDTFTTALDNFGTANALVPAVPRDVTFKTQFSEMTAKMTKEADLNNLDYVTLEIGEDSFTVPSKFIASLSKIGEVEREDVPMISLADMESAQRAQKFWQRILLFGNRPQDFYYLNWRVKYLDSRLRLPEYLSSSSDLVAINTVTNNTTVGDTVAGDKAATASAYDKGNVINRFAEEYGVLISILSIMPETSYAYGQSRLYSKLDKFDYALPLFATLGLDAVYDSEIVSCPNIVPNFADNNKPVQSPIVFGAQGRYYDNKSKNDEEHGLLQSDLSMYTFARQFNPYAKGGRPVLNYEFVHCFPRLDMFVVEDDSQDIFRYDIKHSLAMERNLPVCSMYV